MKEVVVVMDRVVIISLHDGPRMMCLAQFCHCLTIIILPHLSLSLACITVCSSTPILTSIPRISCLTLARFFLMFTNGEPSVIELPLSSISLLMVSMSSVI